MVQVKLQHEVGFSQYNPKDPKVEIFIYSKYVLSFNTTVGNHFWITYVPIYVVGCIFQKRLLTLNGSYAKLSFVVKGPEAITT